jgi:plastocyanin
MTLNAKIRAGFLPCALGLLVLGAPAMAAEAKMDQKHLQFIPDTLNINVGDTVRFTNADAYFHDITITSPDGIKDDRGLQDHGKNIVYTFTKAGTFKVTCRLHPAMKATIVVK